MFKNIKPAIEILNQTQERKFKKLLKDMCDVEVYFPKDNKKVGFPVYLGLVQFDYGIYIVPYKNMYDLNNKEIRCASKDGYTLLSLAQVEDYLEKEE